MFQLPIGGIIVSNKFEFLATQITSPEIEILWLLLLSAWVPCKAFEGKIKFQDLPAGTYNAHHLFIIEVEKRKELYDFLHSKGILAQIHYVPVYTMPYYKKIGYEGSDLINAENYYSKCISLPMYPTLSNEEQNFVIDQVLKFISDEH